MPILLLCFLPFLAGGCLTTKKSNSPAIRGLTNSEAQNLETLNQRDIPSKPWLKEKEASQENLPELAEMFLQSGNYERSIYNYSKILNQQPERHEVRYKMGVALLLNGQPDEAKQQLAEALIHRPDLIEAHEALGIIHLQENNPAAARQEFRAVLDQNPKRFHSRFLLGEAYLREQQYSQALPEFKAALDLAPHNARTMSCLGWTYFKLKNADQALTWLKKAQTLNPADRKTNSRLGMVLAEQKKFPEALEAFRKAGDEAQAFNNIGVYYYLEHRYAEAARCFQKALELRPTFYQEAQVNLEKTLSMIQEEKPAPANPETVREERLSLNRHPQTNTRDLRD
jgi:Flp pilus assembly protein TadD